MISLVGSWETVIYVSDRLPVFFPVKEQQSLLKYQRSMWAKDVNFIENSKHKLSFVLANFDSEDKHTSLIEETNGDMKHQPTSLNNHAEKRKANCQSVSTDDLGAYIESPEKRRKRPESSIPTDLLASYFNPEIFKQTQINKADNINSDVLFLHAEQQDKSHDDS